MNKKIAAFILCCIITILFLVVMIYGKNIFRLFKQSVYLNYHEEIAYIELGKRFSKDGNYVRIENREDIEKILNFLNSLELIEENVIRYNPPDLSYFTISIIRSNPEVVGRPPDLLSFQTDYISFSQDGRDWESKRYYIKNSGYDNQTKKSKVYEFLYDMLSE